MDRIDKERLRRRGQDIAGRDALRKPLKRSIERKKTPIYSSPSAALGLERIAASFAEKGCNIPEHTSNREQGLLEIEPPKRPPAGRKDLSIYLKSPYRDRCSFHPLWASRPPESSPATNPAPGNALSPQTSPRRASIWRTRSSA